MALVAIGLLLAAGQFVVIPMIIRQQLAAMLAGVGMEGTSYELHRASLWGTELRQISSGTADPMHIDRIEVGYSPVSLWHGRIKTIRIEGFRLVVAQYSGQLEAGPLRSMFSHLAAVPTSTTGTDWPLESIDLISSEMSFGPAEDRIVLPFDANLHRAADGGFSLKLIGSNAAKPIAISGTFDPRTRNGDISCDSTLDAGVMCGIARVVQPGLAVSGAGPLKATARFRFADGKGNIQTRLASTNMSIGIGGTNVEGIQAVLNMTGNVAAEALSNLKLTIEQAKFNSAEYELSCDGISGSLVLLDLSRPDDRQRVAVKRLNIGNSELTDGEVVFQLEDWRSLLIQQTSWKWLGGTVSSGDIRISPPSRKIALTLAVQAIDLHSLLDLLASGRATGEGRVSGAIPMTIDWPRVAFGHGELQAVPGGQLSITDAAVLEQTLDQTIAVTGQDRGMKQNIVEALNEFQYSVLTADLNGENGLTAKVRIAGQGKQGLKQPLDLELRISGLDNLLNGYLGIRQKIQSGN